MGMSKEWDEIVDEAKRGQVAKLPVYGLIFMALLGIAIGILADGTKAGLALMSSTFAFGFLAYFSQNK